MKRNSFAAVLAQTVLLASCGKDPIEPPAKPAPARDEAIRVSLDLARTRIHTVRPERRAPSETLIAIGRITAEPDGAAEVTPAVTARITSIAVRPGDEVKRGDALAVLEAGEVARVTSDLERARARVRAAEGVHAQETALSARNATSERLLQEAKSALEQARAEEQAAAALLASYGAHGGRHFTLRAPIAGTVARIRGVVGTPVDPTTPLFRVIDTHRLVARADIPESDADLVAPGTEATIYAFSKKASCQGTIESHPPLVDTATRTVPFRIRLMPECGELHEGASVDVALRLTSAPVGPAPLLLPRDAVVSVNETTVVFVQGPAPNEFHPRTVRVTSYRGPIVFVEDGVTEADQVVDRGSLLLKGELMRAELQ